MTPRDAAIARRVRRWFKQHARDLPWRHADPAGRRDPYTSLVSEVMLQQTQVARVLEKFRPFMARFPTVKALATADERDVLAAWSGMGYYRRARSLHAAAKAVVARFAGRVPDRVEDLLTLPGIGRYTAGAIASIVFDRPAPIVDGNVARVLMRVQGRELNPAQLWSKAESLAHAPSPGLVNEGLMELGAVICLPRGPRCNQCPLRQECRAHANGLAHRLPKPRKRLPRQRLFCATVILQDARGRLLVEQRSDSGMWAGLWQAPTLESPTRPTRRIVQDWIGITALTKLHRFSHDTTHRHVEFQVWTGPAAPTAASPGRTWRSPSQLRRLAISNAQRRILIGEQ